MDRKRRGASHNFLSEFFSQCTKTFAEEHFFDSEAFPFRNSLWKEEKRVARSYVDDFLLAVLKFFIEEPCVVSKHFGYRFFYG